MRITVNLSIFFHDHRSLAKIFINKKMKIIRNVEDHITDIFKIKDFYLKCDNQYLPPTENVQILNYDDIVWAVPIENHVTSVNQNGFLLNEKTENTSIIIEKKKKENKEPDINDIVICEKKRKKEKKHYNENFTDQRELKPVENNEELMEVEKTPPKPKRKKNKKSHDVKDASFTSNGIEMKNSEDEHNDNMCGTVNKKTKIQIHCPEDATPQKSSPKDSGRDSLEGSKHEDAMSENGNISVKSLVDSFESKRINFAKRFRQAVNDNDERRVNIVKTIIITNKSNAIDEPKPDLPSAEHADLSNQQQEENSDPSPKTKNEDNVNTHDDSSNLETSNSISNSTSNELSSNITKRKRKRVRKRKHRSNSRREVTATFEKPVYNFIHKPLIVQTPTHIRFRGEPSTSNYNESPTTNDLVTNNEPKDSSKNEVIIIRESPGFNAESAKPDEGMEEAVAADVDVTNIEAATFEATKNGESTYSDREIEECILKQPITANAEPRIGDVIAFKILKISESYTPEVSSTVVGKVINYISESKEITFHVVYGREQCVMPQGKFHLDQEDHPLEDDSQFQCCWSSLLEPRLLFP